MTTTPNPQARALELLKEFARVFRGLDILPAYNHAQMAVELQASIHRENALRAEVERLRTFAASCEQSSGSMVNGNALAQEAREAMFAFSGRRTARNDPSIPTDAGVPPREAHSMSEYRRMSAQGADVLPPSMSRIDVIGQNGPTGEHYDIAEPPQPTNNRRSLCGDAQDGGE